ncbi:MAG: nucleoside 2-deoxyribosyltransferase [Hungatella sp.]|jgi:nucleoside 2-deoxyribosyltransferase|nr:nucleoside 2-deoxyribosyltransferase [Hungatella sp.]
MYKIFIACPISKYLREEEFTNLLFKQFITKVYELCRKYSDNVFLALEREKYGKARMEDEVCTPLDYKEMEESNLVIAIPEDSMGVAVEIGWASALKKDVILMLDHDFSYSPLVKAIGTVVSCDIIDLPVGNKYSMQECGILNSLEEKIAARFHIYDRKGKRTND